MPKKQKKMIAESGLVDSESGKVKKDWFGALKGIGHFSKADELN